jgi:high-affinity iron transporter
MLSALLIAAREGLEAALIIGIVLGYLNRTGRRDRMPFAYFGIAAAVFLSGGLALGMHLLGAELETPFEQIFEGTTMLLAVGVLTWMIFWMRYQARSVRANLERRVNSALRGGQAWPLFALAFLAVFREGLEMALFMAANAFAADALSTLVGALAGLALATTAGALLYVYSIRLDLGMVFGLTSIFLVVFAAGLFASGIHEFQEIGWLPILTNTAWDTKWLLDSASGGGSVLRSLVGYNDQPSLLEVVTYVGYWAVVLQGVRWWTRRLAVQSTIEPTAGQATAEAK